MLPHALNGLAFVERFYSFNEIDSTNEYARKLKHCPQKGIYVIQAEKQNAGRGRRGNSFFSVHEGGLWVSLITPVKSISEHFIHNRAISIAICETLRKTDRTRNVKIKWPNDIYWGDRKIAGILLETVPVSSKALIVGFGLNVNIPLESFPPILQQSATSLLNETGKRHSPSELLRSILRHYYHCCSADQRNMHGFYCSYLYKPSKRVTLDDLTGDLEKVEQDGRIVIRTDDGLEKFTSGTLRFLPAPKA
ncbi:MAG: biotin--[acetyl-CoA-carboxylase] ligase [Chitinispirillaceae bacterium]